MNAYFMQNIAEARIADLHAEAALRRHAAMVSGTRSRRTGIATQWARARTVTSRWIGQNAFRPAVRQEPACCIA